MIIKNHVPGILMRNSDVPGILRGILRDFILVIPAKAGIQTEATVESWIPAFAGMTIRVMTRFPVWRSQLREIGSGSVTFVGAVETTVRFGISLFGRLHRRGACGEFT